MTLIREADAAVMSNDITAFLSAIIEDGNWNGGVKYTWSTDLTAVAIEWRELVGWFTTDAKAVFEKV